MVEPEQVIEPSKTISDLDYLIQSQTSNSIEPCLNIVDKGVKRDCKDQIISKKAIEANDLSSCDKIENNHFLKTCRQTIISSKAAQEDNSNVCYELEDPSNCLDNTNMRSGISNLDESRCKDVSDERKRDICISYVIPTKAVQQDDINICQMSDKKDKCQEYYYLIKSKDNKQLCEQISNTTVHEWCISDVPSDNLLYELGLINWRWSRYVQVYSA